MKKMKINAILNIKIVNVVKDIYINAMGKRVNLWANVIAKCPMIVNQRMPINNKKINQIKIIKLKDFILYKTFLI